MLCAICGTRKPRRPCAASAAEICTVCCATGREESIDCPLSCEYLRDAHRHETKPDYDVATVPNQDIKVTEAFLAQHEVLLAFVAIAAFEGALANPGTTDWDVREGFEALIQTVRAAESGIFYETRPVNPYAASVVDKVLRRVGEIRDRETAASGRSTLTDEMLLGVLAFLQRLEYSHNNGRKRCRAFLDFLSTFYMPEDAAFDGADDDEEELFTEPEEPRIIL